jgi:hypothetical protein
LRAFVLLESLQTCGQTVGVALELAPLGFEFVNRVGVPLVGLTNRRGRARFERGEGRRRLLLKQREFD